MSLITPDEVVKKAKHKYPRMLKAWLAGDESFFPLTFPAGKPTTNLIQRRQQIDKLRQKSKEITGQGYAIEWRETRHRDLGKQTTPDRIIIASLEDYLALLRRRTEFEAFAEDVERIRLKFPSLENWLRKHPLSIIDQHGQWSDLLLVCDYFVKQPRPNIYIRELPIPVHTKFIEQNKSVLRQLLDELLPDSVINKEANDFTERFGLKDKPALVRLRLLDEQLDWHLGLRIDDITLPVNQLVDLLAQHIQPNYVIIVENQINFLTLPRIPNSVGLWGHGFGVHLLHDVKWLHECKVFYWGDIDAHGFEILSDIRSLFPHVQSVMMDRQTLDDNNKYVVSGNNLRAERYDSLTGVETQLAKYVTDNDLRLEQEHIPHSYAISKIRKALSTDVTPNEMSE